MTFPVICQISRSYIFCLRIFTVSIHINQIWSKTQYLSIGIGDSFLHVSMQGTALDAGNSFLEESFGTTSIYS